MLWAGGWLAGSKVRAGVLRKMVAGITVETGILHKDLAKKANGACKT